MTAPLSPTDAAIVDAIAREMQRLAIRNEGPPTEVTVHPKALVGFAKILTLDVLHSEYISKGTAVLTTRERASKAWAVPQ